MKNFLKEKLNDGKKVIGTWNTISSPRVTDIIASSGLDFIFIDFEHGPFDIGNVTDYVSSCERYNVSPIVRIPTNESWMALQALDQGAHGIICPYVETAEQAQKLVEVVKYPPLGKRGFTPYTKAGLYAQGDNSKHSENQNNKTMTMALVESLDGLKNIDAISKVDDLDLIFFGSFDISQALGMAGNTRSDEVVSEIKKAMKIAKDNGKYVGGYLAMNESDIDWVCDLGFDLLVYQVDSGIIAKEYSKAVRKISTRN